MNKSSIFQDIYYIPGVWVLRTIYDEDEMDFYDFRLLQFCSCLYTYTSCGSTDRTVFSIVELLMYIVQGILQ